MLSLQVGDAPDDSANNPDGKGSRRMKREADKMIKSQPQVAAKESSGENYRGEVVKLKHSEMNFLEREAKRAKILSAVNLMKDQGLQSLPAYKSKYEKLTNWLIDDAVESLLNGVDGDSGDDDEFRTPGISASKQNVEASSSSSMITTFTKQSHSNH